MKIKSIAIALSLAFSTQVFAVDSNSCDDLNIINGTKECSYDQNVAASFALQHWDKKKNNEYNPFGTFPNNCTHFVGQAILAGFIGSTDLNTIHTYREEYAADKGEPFDWYYINHSDYGNSWSQAHSLYLYAKSNNDLSAPYSYNGVMYKHVTRDYISSLDPNGNTRPNGGALDVSKVQIGDVIFIDYSDRGGKNYSTYNVPLQDIKTDGIMEHAYIVTKIQRWRSGYNEIRVASNDNHYADKGLGDINEDSAYDRKLEFHVYRPYNYIEK